MHTHTIYVFFYKLVESPVFSHCNKKLCYEDFSHLPFAVTQNNSPSSDQDTRITLPFYPQSTEHFFLSRHSWLRNQANCENHFAPGQTERNHLESSPQKEKQVWSQSFPDRLCYLARICYIGWVHFHPLICLGEIQSVLRNCQNIHSTIGCVSFFGGGHLLERTTGCLGSPPCTNIERECFFKQQCLVWRSRCYSI